MALTGRAITAAAELFSGNGLKERIDRGTFALYVMGIVALTFSLFSVVGWRSSMLFGSGIVTYALQEATMNPGVMTSILKWAPVAIFFALSYGVHRRMRWAAGVALAFVIFDAGVPFVFAGNDSAIGLLASIQIVFHVLICWWIFDAFRAMHQWRVNADIARSLEVEAKLRHRLAESDAPPPPAATFTTRYRSTPPR